MKMIKTAAFLLAAAMFTPCIASCGDTQTPDQQPADTQTSAVSKADTEPVEVDPRQLVSDDLGEHDFGGYIFRIVTSENRSDYMVVDTATGDVIDDAVFQRNQAVEDRFNCKITVLKDYPTYDELGQWMDKTVKSAEDAFDLVSNHAVDMGNRSLSAYFLNWYDIPNINFDKPWWSSSTINDLTYDGVCLLAVGDFALSAIGNAYCVFYNKTLGQNYDFPNLYEVVNDGKWTFDYLIELSKDIYVDTNQNGKVDNEDMFGFTSDSYSNVNAYLWAFDNPVFKKKNDVLEFSYKTEKLPAIVEKLCDAFKQYQGIHTDTAYVNDVGTAHNLSRDLFAKGQSVLANGYISMSLTHFRELKDDFGILPYPKWDEAQKQYYTMSDGNHEIMAVPKTATDLDRLGTIVEALCAESYRTLVPAYYDVALKVKSARDEESFAMLDMIVNSRVFDFGYVYDAWKGCSFFLEQLVQGNNNNFESFWAKKEKAVMKHYDKVIKIFEEYENE